MLTSRFAYREGWGPRFAKAYRRYRNLRHLIDRRMAQVLADPYAGTERLGKVPGGIDLRGCRSIRVTRNFRIIFVVCEECRRVPECRFCFCEGLSDETVVFLTVGPHERAYTVREEAIEYGAQKKVREETSDS